MHTKRGVVINTIALLLSPLFYVFGDSRSTSECYCGYGGLCFRDAENSPYKHDCRTYCPQISGGYYSEDCLGIKNHCDSSPCVRGECVNTFGSFYCKCPKDYFGKICNHHEPILTGLGLTNEVYIYHQVQPYKDGTNDFHVVYDPKDQSIMEQSGIELLVTVEVDNGRVTYPARGKHFVLYNIMEKCLADIKENPDLHDPNVCKYLPQGKVWTFSFGCTSFVPSYVDRENIVSSKGIGDIGRKGWVKLRIEVADGRRLHYVLFEEIYSIFTYSFHARIPHNCRIHVEFDGCSNIKTHPTLYSLGDYIRIGGITNFIDCKGVLSLKQQWFLQRNINRIRTCPYDRSPRRIYNADASDNLAFRPRNFGPGLHSIEFALNLRGSPPVTGAINQFTFFSRCWINVATNVPSFGIEGGDKRTAHCYQSLRLKVILFDSNYALSDFSFISWCQSTVKDDEECKRRNMEGPYLNKYTTPCNAEYNYTILATHRGNVTPPVEFTAQIFLVETETELLVQCIHNCKPIDPEMKVLVGAWTTPYAPQPVLWNVSIEGVPLDPKHLRTTGFLRSSRILIVDGASFIRSLDRKLQSVDVELRASKGSNHLHAALSSKVDILKADLVKFQLSSVVGTDKIAYTFKNDSEIHFIFNNPMTFAVYSIHEKIREVILEVKTNYLDSLQFSPLLNKVILCLKDSLLTFYIQKCTRGFNLPKWEPVAVMMDELEFASRNNDARTFLKQAQGYLIKSLGALNSTSTILRWNISLEQRNRILFLMRNVQILSQFDVMCALSILSMMLYSEEGCQDQELPTFKPDLNILTNFHDVSTLLKMNYFSIQLMERAVTAFRQRLSRSVLKIRDYGFGDVLDKIVSAWTISFFQDAFVAHAFSTKNPTVRDLYISAEIEFWRTKNRQAVDSVGLAYLRVLMQTQRSYYGLRYIGRGSVRVWAAKTTYSCLLDFLNKSNPLEETLPKHVDYVFGTGKSEEGWISVFNLTLPSVIRGWEYEKLSFVIVVIKNRRGDPRRIAPSLVVELRTRSGATKELSIDNGYRVVIPTMVNGEMSNTSHQFVKDVFIIEKWAPRTPLVDYHSLSAYKITLPLDMRKFTFFIYLEKPISFKVQIFYDHAPDYNAVAKTADVRSEYDDHLKLYAVKIPAYPPPGEKWVRRPIYLGLLPSEMTPPGIHSFWGQNTLTYCQVAEVKNDVRRLRKCIPELPTGYTGKYVAWDEIHCYCFNFGVLTAHKLPLETAKILIDHIYFASAERHYIPGIVFFSCLYSAIALVLVICIFCDHKRGKKHTLVYVEDGYPTDNVYTLVVGVYTGMNPLAGTTSSVAIKIIGSNASSRVHILKCQSRKSFVSGSDDWFVIPLSQPLGKITTVSFWHNFKQLSDWYCSRIMIYEVKSYRWYCAIVERWLTCYPTNEESKMVTLPVTEIEQFEDDMGTEDNTFDDYYFKELRSTHLPFSLICLHHRSLSTYERKYLMYLAKICGVLFWTWVLLEHFLRYIYKSSHEDEQLMTTLNLESSTMVLFIALFSRLFSAPLHILDNVKVVSRILQRRTTRPFFSSKDSSRIRRSESRSFSNTLASPRVDRTQSRASQRPEGRESRYSRTERIRSTQRPSRYSSVDFRRKSSRGTSLHELSWRKPTFQGRSTLVSLAVGPHQFRSVNVSQTVFKQKTRRNLLTLRVLVGLGALISAVLSAYLEFFSGYWRKTKIKCFLAALTLFFDAVVVDPFIILVKSFIAYVFLGFSNKEVNIWNDEVRHEIKIPPTLMFHEYVEKATRVEYKPLLSAELDVSYCILTFPVYKYSKLCEINNSSRVVGINCIRCRRTAKSLLSDHLFLTAGCTTYFSQEMRGMYIDPQQGQSGLGIGLVRNINFFDQAFGVFYTFIRAQKRLHVESLPHVNMRIKENQKMML